MKAATQDELRGQDLILANSQGLLTHDQIARIREILFMHGKLIDVFAEVAEWHLATREMIMGRKSTPKSDIKRYDGIKNRLKFMATHYGAVSDRAPRLKELVQEI